MKVRVYVEGGGDSKDLRIRCRKGFSKLFERAGLGGRMPKVVACGSRGQAFRSFRVSSRNGRNGAFPVLLVDSEGPVAGALWDHLQKRDGWKKPPQVSADQAHLMVQVMEAWFLADAAALHRFYGSGFRENALPPRADVEAVGKREVLSAIDSASRGTTKGAYSKGRHSFQVLELIDPAVLEERAPHAKRLFDMLRLKCR